MRVLPFAVICGSVLAACADAPPTSPVPPPAAANLSTTNDQPSEWRGHWNSPLELWVYDTSPEVGLNVPFNWWEYVQDHANFVEQAGMRLARTTIYWTLADPNDDGVYDDGVGYLDGLKRTFKIASDDSLEIVAVVHGGYVNEEERLRDPNLPWGNSSSLSDFNSRFGKFLSDMSTRFPEIRFWQIWNEMDVGIWAGPWNNWQGPSPREHGIGYAKTLRAVYPVIKSDPGDWVILGGLAEVDTEFLHGMYGELDRVGKPYAFDIFAFHGYGTSPNSGQGPYAKIHSLTPIMNQYGDVNRPIWVTETGTGAKEYVDRYGWPGTNAASVFDEAQRTYYQSLVTGLYGSPASKAIGYSILTTAGDPPYDMPGGEPKADYNLSILRSDMLTTRPSYDWLRSMAATIEGDWNRPAGTGSFSVTTFGTVPATHSFAYSGDGLIIQDLLVNTLEPTSVPFINPISYQPYMEYGWMYEVYNNQVAGWTSGTHQMRQLKVNRINLPNAGSVCYQVHTSTIGWPVNGAWTCDGGVAGNSTYQMEAVKIRLTNSVDWSICYQVYIPSNSAWTPWSCDGTQAGTVGQAKAMSGIRIQIRRNTLNAPV